MHFISKILLYPYTLTYNNTVDTFKDIKGDIESKGVARKVFNFVSLIPFVAGIVMFLISLITFIAGGGFVKEIDLVKTEGLGSINHIWTAGNTGYFYIPWLCIAVGVVFLVLLVVAALDLYKHDTMLRKILFSILAVLFVAVSALIISIAFNPNIMYSILGMFGLSKGNNHESIVLGITLLVDLALAVGLAVMLSRFKPFIRCFVNEIFYFAIAPLTCLIVINIIGLVVFAVVMLIIWIVGMILGNSVSSSSSGSGTGSSPSAADRTAQAKKEAKEREDNKRAGELERLYKQREELQRHWDACVKSNWDTLTCVNYGVTNEQDFIRNINAVNEKIKRLGGK
ncbi:MAG: hypothetical protein E7386_01125 [Ruminococcaceae bacterium]|nr:hypothetical protein [Oscillospiraceae bacterium]